MKVTTESRIADVLAGKKGAAEVFEAYGAHCLDCNNSKTKKVGEMAEKHGADPGRLVDELNRLPDA